MNDPTTAREALIAEALGAIGPLADRVEACVRELDRSRDALLKACEALAAQSDAADRRMAALAQHARTRTVEHIARRTDELAQASLASQRRAMEEAARAVFRAEVGPALQRLVAPLQRVVELAGHRPAWHRWLAHAATAAASSLFTWVLAGALGPW